jgi:hypothetical protein
MTAAEAVLGEASLNLVIDKQFFDIEKYSEIFVGSYLFEFALQYCESVGVNFTSGKNIAQGLCCVSLDKHTYELFDEKAGTLEVPAKAITGLDVVKGLVKLSAVGPELGAPAQRSGQASKRREVGEEHGSKFGRALFVSIFEPVVRFACAHNEWLESILLFLYPPFDEFSLAGGGAAVRPGEKLTNSSLDSFLNRGFFFLEVLYRFVRKKFLDVIGNHFVAERKILVNNQVVVGGKEEQEVIGALLMQLGSLVVQRRGVKGFVGRGPDH